MRSSKGLYLAQAYVALLFCVYAQALPRRGPRAIDILESRQCGNQLCDPGETTADCAYDCGLPALTNTYSAVLDASNETFSCTDAWAGNYTQLTVAMWVRPVSLATTRVLISKTTAREFIVQTDASDSSKLRFSQGTSSSNYCITDANALANNTWAHLVFVWRGESGADAATKCFIYVNGVNRVASYAGTIQDTVTDGSAVIVVNGSNIGGVQLNAYYDEIAIWRTALTSYEVGKIYNGGVPGNPSQFTPLIWWRMGDDVADEFDSTSGSKLLVDQRGLSNCTPVNTEGADKSTTVP